MFIEGLLSSLLSGKIDEYIDMKSQITDAITGVLSAWDVAADFTVEPHSPGEGLGDFASNVALVGAKALGKNPRELAEEMVAALEGKLAAIEKIEVAGPGFINFYLTRESYTQSLEAILENEVWGTGEGYRGEEVLFEYTSPNLFKPLHIGNLVGNIIGESLSRLLEAQGATVRRCNYPSDIGPTVAKGVWGLKETGGDPDDITALGEAYRYGNEQYENNPEAKAAIDAVNKALYAGSDEELNDLRARGIATSRARLNELCAMLGTQFDRDIPESEAGPAGQEVVEQHIGEIFVESEGAIVFPEEKSGLHTRVFLNSQRLPTYEAKDLGNFLLKQATYPTWSQMMIVTGGEQTDYFKVLLEAIRQVFPEAGDKHLEHIPTGFLTLTTGKMSSRKGNVLSGEDLIEEVRQAALSRAEDSRAENVEVLATQIAVAALKFQILRQKVGSDIVFDKEQALSFEGDSGPYLQYTNVRLRSLLEKGQALGITPATSAPPAEAYAVEQLLPRFEAVLTEATAQRAPHKLIGYLLELSSSFNTLYGQEKMIDEEEKEQTAYRLAVVAATQKTLERGLYLLGIPTPEKM